jgi:hypothetical protein
MRTFTITLLAILTSTSLLGQDTKELNEPVLGVKFLDISKTHKELEGLDLDLPTKIGVLLWRVDAYGPAYRAGLSRMNIILKIGRTLIRSADDYHKVVRQMKPGSEHRATVYQSVKPNGVGPWKKKTVKISPVERQRLYLDALRVKADEIRGTTFYQHLDSAEGVNRRTDFFCYIVKRKSGDLSLRLNIQYVANDWLFVRYFVIQADDKTFTFKPASSSDFERDNAGGKIWEWYDKPVGDEEMNFLKAIANADKVVVRFVGDQYQKDLPFTDEGIHQVYTMLTVFRVMGGKMEGEAK